MKKIEQLPPVSPEMRQRASELRNKMTDSERRLWRNLRIRQLGAYFHRQRVVGRYICDFVSLDPGLVVEVDGSQHYLKTGQARDKERDEYLKSLGFEVLRFSNRDVMNNMEGVLTVIKERIENKVTPP